MIGEIKYLNTEMLQIIALQAFGLEAKTGQNQRRHPKSPNVNRENTGKMLDFRHNQSGFAQTKSAMCYQYCSLGTQEDISYSLLCLRCLV